MVEDILADASHEPKSFVTYLVVGLAISAVIVVVFVAIVLIPSAAVEQSATERARLYINSELFWMRWPKYRLFEAPYDQLAAESARCERAIAIHQRRRGTNIRPGPGPAREAYDEANRQIATYQDMLGTVQHAMSYAISQGRGPLQ